MDHHRRKGSLCAVFLFMILAIFFRVITTSRSGIRTPVSEINRPITNTCCLVFRLRESFLVDVSFRFCITKSAKKRNGIGADPKSYLAARRNV